MALGIQFVLAKQYSETLSVNTKRGNVDHASLGEYMGRSKLGYNIVGKKFIPNSRYFQLIRNAWEAALDGYSTEVILKRLNEAPTCNIKITKNRLLRIFEDPFYAGFNVHGEVVADLKSIDKSFRILATPEEFIKLRKIMKDRGLRVKTNADNPLFKDMLTCFYCGKTLKTYVNRGRTRRYFIIECRNQACPKPKVDRNTGKKVKRTLRGYVVLNFIEKLLSKGLNVEKKAYDYYVKAVEKALTKELKEKQGVLLNKKISLSKAEGKKDKVFNMLDSTPLEDALMRKSFGDDYRNAVNNVEQIKKEIGEIEDRIQEIDGYVHEKTVTYEEFANFFQIIGGELKYLKDHYLIDEIVRIIFANLTLDHEKVLSYQLNEPFKTYSNIGSVSHGVVDGTRTHNPRYHKPML